MVKKIDKKAFTLIEVIVVIAIVGILTLLALPRVIGYAQKAELTRIKHDVKAMEQEIGPEFINGNDGFNKWENNIKDLNQLVQDDKLFEKEGIVKKIEVFSIGETHKVIPENYGDKINTKLEGTFYANSDGKVYYEHTKPLVGIPTYPEYSDEEIEDKIKEGYIPIATADELNSIRSGATRMYGEGTKWEGKYIGGLNKKYVQVKNIDLSVYSVEGWSPIGNYSAYFTGTYDGGNYVITGLEVKGEGKDNQGLFGHTIRATISNVSLEDVNVTGKEAVGGLVGKASHTKISNSYATGSVTGASKAGGLVGYAGSSTRTGNEPMTTISNSYATGEVTGNTDVGGLVGLAFNHSKITNSYATGSVEGAGRAIGGLVGYALSDSTISNSYATGSVIGSGSDAGGLVGAASSSTISNSYSTGSVEGAELYIGGLVGQASYTPIENSYATGSVKGNESVGGLAGYAGSSTISNSYATGSVTGASKVGGLVGLADDGSSIENSYATGTVEGASNSVGGLVGYSDSYSSISNSYAIGLVTGKDQVGGLVGKASYRTATKSYWDTATTKQTKSAGGEGKPTVDMMKQATYLGWDFENVWEIDEGKDYPKLR